jgi:hypothetical protein
MNDDQLPEMLYAAGLAAAYCAADGWDGLESWARREGFLLEGERMPRELMRHASAAIDAIVRQAEAELLALDER